MIIQYWILINIDFWILPPISFNLEPRWCPNAFIKIILSGNMEIKVLIIFTSEESQMLLQRSMDLSCLEWLLEHYPNLIKKLLYFKVLRSLSWSTEVFFELWILYSIKCFIFENFVQHGFNFLVQIFHCN